MRERTVCEMGDAAAEIRETGTADPRETGGLLDRGVTTASGETLTSFERAAMLAISW